MGRRLRSRADISRAITLPQQIWRTEGRFLRNRDSGNWLAALPRKSLHAPRTTAGRDELLGTPAIFARTSGIFPHTRLHLTNLRASGGEGGLTCLSFRCLSIYLIFSASSSDS